MNTYKSFVRRNFFSLCMVYLCGLVFFGMFRLVLLLLNLDQLTNITGHKASLILGAFWMGIRFDTVISCYILAVPVLICSVLLWFRYLKPLTLRIIYIFVEILFVGAFLLCATDIPFFNQFFARLNNTALNWFDSFGFVVKMIVQEPRYLAFALVFLVLATAYLWIMHRIMRYQLQYLPVRSEKTHWKNWSFAILGSIVLFGLVFVGMRGRVAAKTPILVGTAFFSEYPFINQLGLNPVYTFMTSCIDAGKVENQNLNWISDDEAIAFTKQRFNHDESLDSISPIARWQKTYPLFKGRNVVLVIMEGMSADKMKYFGNSEELTPFLDSLAHQAWIFENMYSAGIHTFNGIYSTLFSHPALMKKHSMFNYFIDPMAGLSNVLADNGYQTIFFIPHDDQFDNVGGFLSLNQFHTIVAQKDYPSKEVKSTLGVPDEYMFRFSIPALEKLSQKAAPFCAVYMTASDHGPYVIPENVGFTPKTGDVKTQIVEYADWSLRKFMEYASQQTWYENTVFAFVADHGAIIGPNPYDICMSYHHIPFLIFAPGVTTPQRFEQLALQEDVFPTIVANMGIPFINNTFGIDLLHEKHPNIVFSTDDKLACMNDSLLYIYRENAPDGLYRYRMNEIEDCSTSYAKVKKDLQKEAFSWLQTSQWMLNNRKTAIVEKSK